jgi:hypothetical protein
MPFSPASAFPNWRRYCFNNTGFADRAAALLIVLNPNENGDFRLRVSLFDQVTQAFPTLILYDWEFPPSFRFADLNFFNFADKTAFVRVERGGLYQVGDRVILRDVLEAGSLGLSLDPLIQEEYNLNEITFLQDPLSTWADRVAGVQFDLQPPVV